MLDPIQILLIVVISLLTLILFIIGLEVFVILKEFKRTLEKMNKILADTGRITEAVADPAVELSQFILGIKEGFTGLTHGLTFLKKITGFFENRISKHFNVQPSVETEPAVEDDEQVEVKPAKAKFSPSKKPRFFLKKGKSLGKV